jgi:hypothetical protein
MSSPGVTLFQLTRHYARRYSVSTEFGQNLDKLINVGTIQCNNEMNDIEVRGINRITLSTVLQNIKTESILRGSNAGKGRPSF